MTQAKLLTTCADAGRRRRSAAWPRSCSTAAPASRQRHGRVERARGRGARLRAPDGRLPRHLALLPAAHLRRLAVLGLHDGPWPLEGGVRRDPRRDRRGDRRPATARRSTPAPSSRRSASSTSPTSTSAGKLSTQLFDRANGAAARAASTPRCGRCGAIGRDPIFIDRGEGAEIVDVDGNRYVDWVCSWGPLIAGHAHPEVVEAVIAAARRGTSFGAPTAGRGRAGRRGGRTDPERRDGADDLVRHRGRR